MSEKEEARTAPAEWSSKRRKLAWLNVFIQSTVLLGLLIGENCCRSTHQQVNKILWRHLELDVNGAILLNLSGFCSVRPCCNPENVALPGRMNHPHSGFIACDRCQGTPDRLLGGSFYVAKKGLFLTGIDGGHLALLGMRGMLTGKSQRLVWACRLIKLNN